MKNRRFQLAALVAVAVAGVAVTTAVAGGGSQQISERLTGFEEVPVVSTGGEGKFKADVKRDRIEWELRYEDLEGDVTQAHIHFGQRDVNGGISVFLCSNLGNGPAGTQPCPPAPAKITGTATAADVIGPTSQLITAGEFDELLQAIKAGMTYANVHSTAVGTGEIRGQLNDDRDDD
jgi:hypothetical protein